MSIEVVRCVKIKRHVPGYGDYHDAIYLTDAEFTQLTDTDIEQHVQQRVSNWVSVIEAARQQPPRPEPTDDEVFGELPIEYVTKFEKWIEKKNKKQNDAPTVPGPSGPDAIVPVDPKAKMKVK